MEHLPAALTEEAYKVIRCFVIRCFTGQQDTVITPAGLRRRSVFRSVQTRAAIAFWSQAALTANRIGIFPFCTQANKNAPGLSAQGEQNVRGTTWIRAKARAHGRFHALPG